MNCTDFPTLNKRIYILTFSSSFDFITFTLVEVGGGDLDRVFAWNLGVAPVTVFVLLLVGGFDDTGPGVFEIPCVTFFLTLCTVPAVGVPSDGFSSCK